MRINQIIRSLNFFLTPTLIFGLTALYFTASYGLAETQLWFNGFHNATLDQLMPIYTYLGDGLVFLVLIPFFLMFKRRALLALVFSGIMTLLFSSALKAYFNEPRPIKYFQEVEGIELRQVPGVKAHYNHSFPSGHTTAAFAAWGVLAYFCRRKSLSLLFFTLASGVAFSRIYLNMHFLRDVGAGAFLGAFIAINAVYLSSKIKSPWADTTWFKSRA